MKSLGSVGGWVGECGKECLGKTLGSVLNPYDQTPGIMSGCSPP